MDLTIFNPNAMWRIIDRHNAAPGVVIIDMLPDESVYTENQCKYDVNSMEKWLDLGMNISV